MAISWHLRKQIGVIACPNLRRFSASQEDEHKDENSKQAAKPLIISIIDTAVSIEHYARVKLTQSKDCYGLFKTSFVKKFTNSCFSN